MIYDLIDTSALVTAQPGPRWKCDSVFLVKVVTVAQFNDGPTLTRIIILNSNSVVGGDTIRQTLTISKFTTVGMKANANNTNK